MEPENFTRDLITLIALGLYGVYLVTTGILIILKKRKILDVVDYIQIFLMNIMKNSEKATKYKTRVNEETNWPRHGVFVMVLGILFIFLSSFLIKTVI